MTHDSMNDQRFTRRRAIGGAAAVAAGTAILTSGAASAAPVRQAPVTIQVWGGVPEENGPQALVDAFNAANEGSVFAEYTRYVNDDTGNTSLDTALQGGSPIDVYFTYSLPRLAQRAGAGAALDLAPYIAQDPDIQNWVTTTEGVTAADGVYPALPTTAELTFFFVNKRLIDDAGITIPDSWTFDEFQSVAEQLSSDMVYGTFARPDEPRTRLGPDYWYNADGTASNFDNEAFRTHLEAYRGMIDAGTAFPWTDVLAQDLRAYAQTPFLTEQNATWSTAAFSLRYVNDLENFPHDFITTFAPHPVPADVAEPWSIGALNNWIMVNPRTQYADASWAFIQFWLKEGAQYMLPGGKVPAFPGTSEDDVITGLLGPNAAELYDVEQFRKVLFAPGQRFAQDTKTAGIAQIQAIWQAETDRYLIGEMDIDETLTSLKQQSDAAIVSAG